MQPSETSHLPAVPGEDNVRLLKLKRLEHMSCFDTSHSRGVVVGVDMAKSVGLLNKLNLTLN